MIIFNDRNYISSIDLYYITKDLVNKIIKNKINSKINYNSDYLFIIIILDIREV